MSKRKTHVSSPGPWRVRYDKHGFARFVWDDEFRSTLRSIEAAERTHQEQLSSGITTQKERDDWVEGPIFADGTRKRPRGYAICLLSGRRRLNGANARLIATAPDLLAAARGALAHLREQGGPADLVKKLARAIGEADGTYADDMSPVDDRAPLNAKGECMDPVCSYGAGKLHDSRCRWLVGAVAKSRELWPMLHDQV